VAIAVVVLVAALSAALLSRLTYADTNSTTKSSKIIDSQNKTITTASSFPTLELTAVKVNPWQGHEVKNGESAGPDTVQEPLGSSIINESYNGINSTQGTVTLNNKAFYMTTLQGNLKSIVFSEPDGTAARFAGVTFTFARPPNIPLPSNPAIPVVVQFKDGTSETLLVQVQKDHPMTVLTSHNNPKVGVTITQGNQLMMTGLRDIQGKVKLLVSTD
jgi:uncharacterized membrane protein